MAAEKPKAPKKTVPAQVARKFVNRGLEHIRVERPKERKQ